MLRNLSAEQLEPFVEHLQMRRYEDGTLLHDHHAPPRPMLRILVHGHASWEPLRHQQKHGAWMMTTGSVFGLAAVHEWARRKELAEAWPITEYLEVRCAAAGPIWVLELSPEHFDQAFGSAGGPLATRLLRHFPTSLHAATIVAELRELPQFSRVRSMTLHRMLEYAPTLSFGPPIPYEKQVQLDVVQLEAIPKFLPSLDEQELLEAARRQRLVIGPGRALYFVIEGSLRVETDTETVYVAPGSLGGPDMFSHHTALLAPPVAVTDTRAVVIDGRVVYEMIRTDQGFCRSLGPHVGNIEGAP